MHCCGGLQITGTSGAFDGCGAPAFHVALSGGEAAALFIAQARSPSRNGTKVLAQCDGVAPVARPHGAEAMLDHPMSWASPWSMQSFWKIAHYVTNYFRLCVRLPALGCRVGKQRHDNGVRLGLRGCLRRFAGKSSSDGNVPKYVRPDNTDLSNVFQICSSAAFGLASPLVSRKPSPAPTIVGSAKRIHGLR